jgi:hypothetical protein
MTLSSQPKPIGMLRGSLVQLRRKCGGENCRCQRGDLHETWALSYSVRGRTHLISLRDEDVAAVRAALERYRRAQEELEKRAMRGIRVLENEKAVQRQRR